MTCSGYYRAAADRPFLDENGNLIVDWRRNFRSERFASQIDAADSA